MAFVLKKDNRFKTKVEVVTPTENGDQKWSFMATLQIQTRSDDNTGGDALDKILVAVEGVPAEEGVSQEEILEMLRSRGDTRAAIFAAYQKAVVKKNQAGSYF